MTEHSAFTPHKSLHGSLQWFDRHAKWFGQSEFIVHSGRQPPAYGLPMLGGIHEQRATLFTTVHTVLSPQGDGLHGVRDSSFAILTQPINASPLYPSRQLQCGVWFTTLHLAL